MRMIHSAKRLRGGRRERAPAISWLLARAAYAANVRSLIDTLIPWRGHELLLRVDPSGSIVAPRTAGSGHKRGVQGGAGEPPGWVDCGSSRISRPMMPMAQKRPSAARSHHTRRVDRITDCPLPQAG